MHWRTLLILLVLPAVLCAQETCTNLEYGYRIPIPAGWTRLSNDQFMRAVNNTNQAGHTNVEWQDGWTSGRGQIMVAHIRLNANVYDRDQLVKQMGVPTAKVNLASPMAVAGGGGMAIVYDPDTRLMKVTGNPTGGRDNIYCCGYGFLGREGFTVLYFYAPVPQFSSFAPTFSTIANSFKYDPGFEYVAPSPYRHIIQFAVIGGGFALLCGVIGIVVFIANKRLKAPAAAPARARPSNPYYGR